MTNPARIQQNRTSSASAYLELSKARVSAMVLMTTAFGFLIAQTKSDFILLGWLLAGTALSAFGANALNQVMEIGPDSRMKRTCGRPLVTGQLSSSQGLWFGTSCAVLGVIILYTTVNSLTALLSAASILTYTLIYTPLKKKTWMCTFVGAVPGALPAAMGVTAITGRFDGLAGILFAILLVWQVPHFYAIAWLYREDYVRGGFPMLPVIDPAGHRVARQSIILTLVLIAITLTPTFLGYAGYLYLFSAAGTGILYLALVMNFARVRSTTTARRTFLASVIHLPVLFVMLFIDRLGT